jgi:hypothetical protein
MRVFCVEIQGKLRKVPDELREGVVATRRMVRDRCQMGEDGGNSDREPSARRSGANVAAA